MSAILFGSIGTIADTSELQRQAFNQAFAKHNLDWQWHRDDYISMLEKSGGKQRIEDYAKSLGQSVDAQAIHSSKSAIFQQLLQTETIEPRPGVLEVVKQAEQQGIKLALVTTTSAQNVASILKAMEKTLLAEKFDIIMDKSDVSAGKPSAEPYLFAVQRLGERTEDCVAIEDNLDGVRAAESARLGCVAFPNCNTAHHNFESANICTDALRFEQLKRLVSNQQRQYAQSSLNLVRS
ncbi:MAG: HAD-IA family hydrolase [Cyanobacteria bacterium P01_D01_bin.36]